MPQCILGGRVSWTSAVVDTAGTLDALHVKQRSKGRANPEALS